VDPFNCFAPINKAFDKLPSKELVETLLKAENKKRCFQNLKTLHIM
jgi:uncharacterized surface protein with fasciclin (FAS1) repeats